MEKVTGRTDDMLIIRGVNVFPGQIEALVLGTSLLAPHYQLEVSRPRHLDELEVRVEPKPELAQAGTRRGTAPRATSSTTSSPASASQRESLCCRPARSIGRPARRSA
jgi:phenylacetate-CoA ligase